MSAGTPRLLRLLARLHGVQTSYRNMRWEHQAARPEALIAVLRSLGAPVSSLDDLPGALLERRRALWVRPLEPVIVAWDGACSFDVRLAAPGSDAEAICRVSLEGGGERRWRDDLSVRPARRAAEVDGVRYVSKRIAVPAALPHGYHRLEIEIGGARAESLVVSAPARAHGLGDRRAWGVFLPLYALRSERNWGAGDFTDLAALQAWTGALGGAVVGTLPFLATFLDEPCDYGPYTPASRLFWNEFYLDLERAPEFAASPRARELHGSAGVRREIESLRAADRVDYRRLMALKRRVLEEMARHLFSSPSARLEALRRFMTRNPNVGDYACFRAAGEKHRAVWERWPEGPRSGVLRPGDYDEEASRYHAYVQWLADEQVGALAEAAADSRLGLYLDLPLGVHRGSYDVWRERDAFVLDASGGAPPDSMFTGGQDWGVSPLHPEVNRRQGYRYVLAYLRHQMRCAGLVRIDHVMGLHRLFWIPRGMSSADGVYVRTPAHELYAIVSLESHRHRCAVVGENLGIVPWYVETTLRRHGIQTMYVMQYALSPDPNATPQAVPDDTIASLNTHDVVPFEGFRRGLDIDDRLALGLLREDQARVAHEAREAAVRSLAAFLEREGLLAHGADERAILRAALLYLARGPARVALVNLEDLWLETHPQNVPGTWQERPNWIRKARLSLEEFREDAFVLETLRAIDRMRGGRMDS